MEGGSEGGREGGRKGGKEGGREGGREGGSTLLHQLDTALCRGREYEIMRGFGVENITLNIILEELGLKNGIGKQELKSK